jgi:hypothetical protein
LNRLAECADFKRDVHADVQPALTETPDLVIGLNPESIAVIWYSPTGTLGNV